MSSWRLKRHTRWLFLLAAVAVSTASIGWSQTPTLERPFPEIDEPRRLGPFLVDPGFEIQSLEYDDNIFLDPETTESTSDLVARVVPSLDAQLGLSSRAVLTIRDELLGEIFLDNDQLNHADNDLDVQLDWLIGRLLLTSEGGWSTFQSRPNAEFDERTRRDLVEFDQTARLFVSPRTDVSATYSSRELDYSDDDAPSRIIVVGGPGGTSASVGIDEALNRTTDELTFELGWRPNRGLRLFASYSSREDDFDSDLAGRDARSRRTTVGVELRPTSRLRGRFWFGNERLRSIDPSSSYSSFDDPVWSARLQYFPGGNTRINLETGRDVVFSTYDANLFYTKDDYAIQIYSYFGRRVGWQAGYEFDDIEYPEINEITSPLGEARADEIVNRYVGILLRLFDGGQFGLRYGIRDRESNVPFAEDQQNYISTNLGWEF